MHCTGHSCTHARSTTSTQAWPMMYGSPITLLQYVKVSGRCSHRDRLLLATFSHARFHALRNFAETGDVAQRSVAGALRIVVESFHLLEPPAMQHDRHEN